MRRIWGTPEQRFWPKVNRAEASECWEWLGAKNPKGYGFFRVHGVLRRAHRFAYEMLVGPIPHGMTTDHLCLNPGCVNPAHMEPVTNTVNLQRRHRRAALMR